MDIRRYALGEGSPAELGLTSTVFLTGITGLIFLPFYLYLFGAGIFWEFLGIFITVLLIWNLQSYRLMRYSRKYDGIFTISGYLEKRFGSTGYAVRLVASVEIIVMSVICYSMILKETALVLELISGARSIIFILLIGIYITISVGGYGMVYLTKSAKLKAFAAFIIVALLVIFLVSSIGLGRLINNMMAIDVTGSVSSYLNILYHSGRRMEPQDYISLISMGLLSSGMPFMLGVFFGEKNGDSISIGKGVMTVYVLFFFAVLSCLGAISRGVLYPIPISSSLSEYISHMYTRIGEYGGDIGRVFAGLYIVAILIGFVSALEGLFHTIVTSIYEDIIISGRLIRLSNRRDRRNILILSCMLGIVTLVLAIGIRQISISAVLVFVAAMGCSISPTVVLSLIWKRMNRYGCVAGLITGMISVPFYKYFYLFGINSVIPSMATTIAVIILFSLITPQPSEKVVEDFLEVKNRITD